MSVIEEGLAKIHSNDNVFYNPAQIVNRDLSMLMVETFLALRICTPAHSETALTNY